MYGEEFESGSRSIFFHDGRGRMTTGMKNADDNFFSPIIYSNSGLKDVIIGIRDNILAEVMNTNNEIVFLLRTKNTRRGVFCLFTCALEQNNKKNGKHSSRPILQSHSRVVLLLQ